MAITSQSIELLISHCLWFWRHIIVVCAIFIGLFVATSQSVIAGAERIGGTHVQLDLLRVIEPSHPATVLCWSPDGKRLADIHDYGREISIWSVESGTLLLNIPRAEAYGPWGGESLSFLSDGKTLLGPAPADKPESIKNAFALWNSETGELETLIPGPAPDSIRGDIDNIAGLFTLSHDGTLLAMRPVNSFAGPLVLYSLPSWRVIAVRHFTRRDSPVVRPGDKTPLDTEQAPRALAFAADNSLSVSLFGGILTLRPGALDEATGFIASVPPPGDLKEISLGNVTVDLTWLEPQFQNVAYNGDGHTMAIGSWPSTKDSFRDAVEQVEDQEQLHKLAYLKFWNTQQKRVVAADAKLDSVRSLDWSYDGVFLAVVSVDRFLQIYRPYSDGGQPVFKVPLSGTTAAVKFAPTSNELAVTSGGKIQIYRIM